jgi:predicted Zn-dependent protease
MKHHISSITLAIAIVTLFAGCSKNPVTGKKQLTFISESQEIAMGKEYDPHIVAQFGLYEDPKMQSFIDEKGKEMAAISHRPNLNYEFKILDSPVVNAFAVPGGYIYFTRGIMAHFSNEAEFAGVLGHEIGHITARHTVIQQRNQILAQLGLIAGIIASPEIAKFAEPAAQGVGLLLLRFGRDAERQSDDLGVQYSSKVGYDARQMGRFFNTLERLQNQSGAAGIPSFLSTHPDPGDRQVTVNKLAVAKQQKLNLTDPKINRESYLQLIDGIVYGEDPRQGYVENNKFYHPELKFEFNVPSGWKHQNSPSQFQMADPTGKGMVLLTLGSGNTTREAAQKALTDYKLDQISIADIKVNGLDAARLDARQVSEQSTLRILGYFINHGSYIYNFLSVAVESDFPGFENSFTNILQSFKNLTDPSKLNRQPQRVRIKTVPTTGTLRNALQHFKMQEAKMEELAILNGMQLSDTVDALSLIKIVE